MTPQTSVFIVGAQKSGTTTLHWLLAAHPDLYVPPSPKEIHFFDLAYNQGIAYYQDFFSGWQGESLIGQTSPLYLYLPEVAGRIARYCRDARIIIVLRDPVQRAHSHYWHSVRYGLESLTFERALQQESERLRSSASSAGAVRHHSYVDRGQYGTQVARYLDLFGHDQVLVLGFDELRNEPAAVARRCYDFVGIDSSFVPSSDKVYNPAMRPRSRRVQLARPFLEDRGGTKLAGLLDRVNLRQGAYPAIDPQTAKHLRDEFASSDAELAELLGERASQVLTWREEGDNE